MYKRQDRYFGSGPDAATDENTTADWAAPLAGTLGGLLLIAAVLLWRGRRTRYDDDF